MKFFQDSLQDIPAALMTYSMSSGFVQFGLIQQDLKVELFSNLILFQLLAKKLLKEDLLVIDSSPASYICAVFIWRFYIYTE